MRAILADMSSRKLVTSLKRLSKGLVQARYGESSSDPWHTFSAPYDGGPLTVASFKKAMRLPDSPEGELREESVEEFFESMRESDDASRYATLRELIFRELKQVKIFLSSSEQVVEGRVYLCGVAADGKIVGLWAIRVWT
jgi:hypothetical protein